MTARLPRSLVALLFKPGFLSSEWRAGRRARYLDPVRLYLIGVLFVLAVDWSLGSSEPFVLKELRAVAPQSIEADRLAALEGLRAAIERDATHNTILLATFIVLPLLAFALAAFCRPLRTLLVDHLVFMLHYGAFFLFAASVLFAGDVADWADSINLVFVPIGIGWSIVYLIRATQRVYGWNRARDLLRIAGFMVICGGSAYLIGSQMWARSRHQRWRVTADMNTYLAQIRQHEVALTNYRLALGAWRRGDLVTAKQIALQAIDQLLTLDPRCDYSSICMAESAFRPALMLTLAGDADHASSFLQPLLRRPVFMDNPLILAAAMHAAQAQGRETDARAFAQRFLGLDNRYKAPLILEDWVYSRLHAEAVLMTATH